VVWTESEVARLIADVEIVSIDWIANCLPD